MTTRRKAYLVSEATAAINDRAGLGLTARTVREYCRTGVIAAKQPMGPKGRYRIPAAELERFITANTGSVDSDA